MTNKDKHFCNICGAEASYRNLVGYPADRWYCNEHKDKGFDSECKKLGDTENE